MKHSTRLPSLCLLAFTLLLAPRLLHPETAQTIALWTFEEWEDELKKGKTVSPIAPEIGTGQATGWHAADSSWSRPAGNGSSQSFNSTNWNPGDYYQFEVSTVGFHSPQLSWDFTRSASGPEQWLLAYSSDGLNFTTHESFSLEAADWRSTRPIDANITISFAGIEALADQPTVLFRLVADSEPATPQGAARVDNVHITAIPIPEPATISLLTGLGILGTALTGRYQLRKSNRTKSEQ